MLSLWLLGVDIAIVVAEMFDRTLGTFGKVPSTEFLPMTKAIDMKIVEDMRVFR